MFKIKNNVWGIKVSARMTCVTYVACATCSVLVRQTLHVTHIERIWATVKEARDALIPTPGKILSRQRDYLFLNKTIPTVRKKSLSVTLCHE